MIEVLPDLRVDPLVVLVVIEIAAQLLARVAKVSAADIPSMIAMAKTLKDALAVVPALHSLRRNPISE